MTEKKKPKKTDRPRRVGLDEIVKPVDIHYCPTQTGQFQAYMPEYLDGEAWKTVPTRRAVQGNPFPVMMGGIMQTIFLFGYEQAKALAWEYAAFCASVLGQRSPKLRLQAYEVVYDIKARKTDAVEA